MTFKAGDIAIIVGAFHKEDYIGRVVTLRECFFSGFYKCKAWKFYIDLGGYIGIAEKHLRPIRDQPGEDETLTWAGFPTTHKEDGMTDEQLTALAAKLVGAEPHGVTTEWCIKHADGIWRDFQPLTDDGDALRLAVKLGIQIHFEGDGCSSAVWANEVMLWIDGGDTEAATRLAITRAAAEIQLQKEREQ